MGQRLRLKRGYDISRFPRQARIVLRALKRYGMILADNGSSWYVSGAPDPGWSNDQLHTLGRRAGQRLRGRHGSPRRVAPWASGSAARAGTTRTGAGASTRRAWPSRAGWAATREEFDTVEVNSTFYRLASRDAVARWVEQTPDGFVFAAKASRYLTHTRRLRDIEQGIHRYYERIMPLVESGKLGPVVWQLPAELQARRRAPSAGRALSSGSRPAATASSSATRAGSRPRPTPSCASTTPRS